MLKNLFFPNTITFYNYSLFKVSIIFFDKLSKYKRYSSLSFVEAFIFSTLEEMKSDTLAGPLYIGTGQTDNLKEVVKMMKLFQERYPHIQFHLLSGDKETLLKQLESGILDFGLFIRDYDLVFKNHPFASKKDNQSK